MFVAMLTMNIILTFLRLLGAVNSKIAMVNTISHALEEEESNLIKQLRRSLFMAIHKATDWQTIKLLKKFLKGTTQAILSHGRMKAIE